MATKPRSKVENAYYDHLHQMTGKERLKRALDLCTSVWRIAADSIRNEFPGISDDELKEKLKQRLRR